MWLCVVKTDLELLLLEARGLARLGLCVKVNVKAPGSRLEEGDVPMTMGSLCLASSWDCSNSCNFCSLILSGSLCLYLVQWLSCSV